MLRHESPVVPSGRMGLSRIPPSRREQLSADSGQPPRVIRRDYRRNRIGEQHRGAFGWLQNRVSQREHDGQHHCHFPFFPILSESIHLHRKIVSGSAVTSSFLFAIDRPLSVDEIRTSRGGPRNQPKAGIADTVHGEDPSERRVNDQLDDSFTLGRSESEWLPTLLSAEEPRYIFEGQTDDQTPN